MPEALILDTDPSPDDAVAFLMACASPEFEVLAITTVGGNVPLRFTTRNALMALDLAGLAHVPVHAGAESPLVGPLVTAEHVHGATGFEGYDLPPPSRAVSPGFAPDRIVELVMARPPGTVTLACLAPLTNAALAFAREPGLPARLRRIVLMGGARTEGGNITPAAEYNFHVDPEAAARVLASGAPITVIPLDVTHQALTTRARLERLRSIGGPVAEAFFHLLVANKRFDEAKHGTDGGPLHDPTVVAWLLRPDLFRGRHVHVAVETSSPLTRGMSVVDWWGVTGRAPNALFLSGIEADDYFDLVWDRLSRLPGRTG